jgi:hypothetical protein
MMAYLSVTVTFVAVVHRRLVVVKRFTIERLANLGNATDISITEPCQYTYFHNYIAGIYTSVPQ